MVGKSVGATSLENYLEKLRKFQKRDSTRTGSTNFRPRRGGEVSAGRGNSECKDKEVSGKNLTYLGKGTKCTRITYTAGTIPYVLYTS